MFASEKYRKQQMTVYPGTYSPLPGNVNEIHKQQQMETKPTVNISEHKDYYKVELSVPGHAKEDFVISTSADELIMEVLQPLQVKQQQEYSQQEFNCECFSYSMKLPQKTDACFISAEYTAGILFIYLPKTETPLDNREHLVVVY
ncbi:MAG: Hsp20/alpha crystallin family protein [Chitinophagaceae bacterium]|nr:Hsp20/alpha crystallin family protein [Chitinophagaceae bacterium]